MYHKALKSTSETKKTVSLGSHHVTSNESREGSSNAESEIEEKGGIGGGMGV